jgi:hypothetical protein
MAERMHPRACARGSSLFNFLQRRGMVSNCGSKANRIDAPLTAKSTKVLGSFTLLLHEESDQT